MIKPFFLALFFIIPLSIQSEVVKGPTIQILLQKDTKGNSIPMLIDARGNKMRLTLGTFVSAIAESWMDEKPTTKTEKLDPQAISFIRLDKEDGRLKSYIYNNKGREERLNLGNLLSAAAQSYTGCTTNDLDNQTVNLKLFFTQDSKSNLQTYLDGPAGKEEFNLGILLREVVLSLDKCEHSAVTK